MFGIKKTELKKNFDWIDHLASLQKQSENLKKKEKQNE